MFTRKHQQNIILPKLLVPSKEQWLMASLQIVMISRRLMKNIIGKISKCNVNSNQTKRQAGWTSADDHNVVYQCYLDARKDTVRFERISRCPDEYHMGLVRTSCRYWTGIGAWKSRSRMIKVRPSSGLRKDIWRVLMDISLVGLAPV